MQRAAACTVFVILISFLAGHSGFAQSSAESVEEQRAVGFVHTLQSGDEDALLAFMAANWIPAEDPEERGGRWNRIVGMLVDRHSKGTLSGVLADDPHSLTVVTEDPDGTPIRFIFAFEATSPHRVIEMGIEAGDGDQDGPQLPPLEFSTDTRIDDISTSLDAWFGQLAKDGMFSGTALVAVDGQPVYEGAWGKASIEWDIDNRVDTRFDLGSINKSFTQIALAQLAYQGKLTFDDHIFDHLPEYPNTDAAKKITIRHLIEQTSGLGDIFTDEFFASSRSQYRTPEDFFPLFADKPLTREPGENGEYSNAGYMVLGAIITAVSGMPYDQYVGMHIFEPAGMKGAGFFAHDEPVPNVAVGYTTMAPNGEEGPLRSNRLMLPAKGNSAGSAQATINDLLSFDNAVREHKLLPPAYTVWYFGGAEPELGEDSAGSTKRSTAETGIAGGAPGVSAVLESSGRLVVIVLSNFDAPITESIARQMYPKLKHILERP